MAEMGAYGRSPKIVCALFIHIRARSRIHGLPLIKDTARLCYGVLHMLAIATALI